DSDRDEDDEDMEMTDPLPPPRISSHTVLPPTSPQLHLMDEDEDDFEDDDEDYDPLSLTRSPSPSITSPPELEHDSDSSEDEAMPPSPPASSIPTFSEKQKESTVTTKYLDSRQEDEEDNKSDFYSEGYYLPPRNQTRIVSTISVY
ncbi:hypothetical protein PC116_g30465, partial [Phytophthora cactorum]